MVYDKSEAVGFDVVDDSVSYYKIKWSAIS